MASSRVSRSPSVPFFSGLLALAAIAGALPSQDPGPQGQGARPVDAQAQKAQDADAPTRPKRPKDVRALFAQFGAMRGMSATYTEQKHLSLLAVPLHSSGALHYMTDEDGQHGRLVRVVEKPEPSKLTVTEKELRIADKRGTEVIDLRQSDRVRLFVTSLMRVFQGDGEALRRHYEVRYAHEGESGAGWRLELTPKKAPLDKILKRLALHGDGAAVTRIVLTEPNGDRTVTAIEKADPRRVFTKQEQRELFGVQPAAPKPSGK